MNSIGFDALLAEVAAVKPIRAVGRISSVGAGTLTVTGLSEVAAQGDLVALESPIEGVMRGEIIGLEAETLTGPTGRQCRGHANWGSNAAHWAGGASLLIQAG